MGDGPKVCFKLSGGHSNSVVGNGDSALVDVERKADFIDIALRRLDVLGCLGKLEFVVGVRSIGYELAKEDVLIGVN